MGIVLPNVEYPPTTSIGVRDVVRPVEDGFEQVAVSRKLCIGETPQGRGVLRLDPGECATPLYLFEPEIGIIIGRFNRWTRIEDRHDASRMRWRNESILVSSDGITTGWSAEE